MTAHKYADILVAIAQGKAISRLIGGKVIDLTPTEALNFIVQDVGGLQIKPDMIFINDIEVPVPVREVLHGQEYCVANVYVEQFAPQESLPEGRGGCQGFTPWTGGACPVVGEVQVVVMFRSGNTFGGLSADCWRWEHYGSVGDILAYKVLTP